MNSDPYRLRTLPAVDPPERLWNAIATALDAAEGDAIADRAAREPDADIVFLAHHGVVVGAPSVALAFDELYYLERACRQQVLAQSTGLPLKAIDPEVVAHTAA
jgi:ribulose-5-phosphate 4-epimerase/fuculose-1-phosphate aldolase